MLRAIEHATTAEVISLEVGNRESRNLACFTLERVCCVKLSAQVRTTAI